MAFAILAAETREIRAKVTGRGGLRSTEQAARQHTVSRDADAELIEEREDRLVSFDKKAPDGLVPRYPLLN